MVSEPVVTTGSGPAAAAKPAPSFIRHARLIGVLTLVSRLFGLVREIVLAHYLGTGVVASAFRLAFTVPNLFRKLFGEGALAAAFIPLYARAVVRQHAEEANRFAAAAVTLLVIVLSVLTVLGELIIGAMAFTSWGARPDGALTLKLAAVMLPYVLLICGTAFLGAILQVHKRFGAPAAAPIILNVIHILVVVIGARIISLHGQENSPQTVAQQTTLAYWMAFGVLVAGVLQLLSLMPALRASGFRLQWVGGFWTRQIKHMLRLSIPVAMGAGVLQISVLMDKGISAGLSQYHDQAHQLVTQMTVFGHMIPYPMEEGAVARLDVAQFLYQFPLGVFAIALATAIFPSLSTDAIKKNKEQFRAALNHGIDATLFEGLAASVGLIIVRGPAIKLMLLHGYVTPHDAELIGRSLGLYAAGIWAFSLLQIINRAYYAMHDTRLPFLMSLANIAINLVVEIPLTWYRLGDGTRLGEAGMAAGTFVSFAVQALWMLWLLDRRVGGLELRKHAATAAKLLAACAVMALACWGLEHSPLYPGGLEGHGRAVWAGQLALLMVSGAAVYIGTCALLGVNMLGELMPRGVRRAA